MSGHLEQNSTIKVCLKDSNIDFKILKYNDLKLAFRFFKQRHNRLK